MTTLPTLASIPDLQWGSLDGINAVWTDSTGPFAAGIVFRVGRVDEPLRHTGITHLAQHLALARFGQEAYHRNGSVDGAFATFRADGDEDEASDFVQHAIRNAARFDAARLGSEVKAVDAEARASGPSLESQLLWTRFGCSGFGLMHSPEFAPRLCDPMQVADWAAHHFVRNNAAFWFAGTPPRWLEVPLPDGEWQLPPSLEPVPAAEHPSVSLSGSGVVAISFLMPRTAAADLAVRLLERRLVTLLQNERRVTREICCQALAIGADVSHVSIAVSCADQHAALVGRLLLDVIEAVLRQGVTRREVEIEAAVTAEELADPASRLRMVQTQAERLLLGGQPRTPEEVLREWRDMDPASMAAELAAATNSLLMILPETVRWTDPRLPIMSAPAGPVVEGRQFHRRAESQQHNGMTELTIGGDGISIGAGRGTARTVLFDACAGMLDGPEDVRVVVGCDGTTIRVVATDWKDGKVITDYLDRVIPTSLRIPLSASA